MIWTDAAAAGDVPAHGMLEVEAGGRALLLVASDGALHAVDAVCPHHQAWLSMGRVDGEAIDCPRHQGRFDLRTGRKLRGPECPSLGVYPVRVAAGRVWVGMGRES